MESEHSANGWSSKAAASIVTSIREGTKVTS